MGLISRIRDVALSALAVIGAVAILAPDELDHACFLCSEPKADKCHRRLVSEYLRSKWGNMEVRHL